MKFFYSLLGITFLFLSSPNQLHAQIKTTGFIRNFNALRTLPEHELITGRNRLRLNLNHSFAKGEISISNDIQNLYTHTADSINYQLREAYVDLYFTNSDLRIGKQIITWGRAEGTFITDILTPVNLTEFLTQDFADLRLGLTALKYTYYWGSDYLQLIVNPAFSPNQLPAFKNRWFPRLPFSTSIPVNIQESPPTNKLKNIQLAARYAFRSNLKYDLDIGILYWRHPTPKYAKTLQSQPNAQLNLTEDYTQSVIAMYSGSWQLSDNLIFTSESAYYNSYLVDYFPDNLRALDLQNPSPSERQQIALIFSQNEDGFLKERPWLITMAGLKYNLGKVTLNGQLINEHIFNYDNTILQEQDFLYTTLSIQREFFRETLQLLAFSRYNFEGNDFWLNPELTYTGIDAVEFSAGTHLFGGEQPSDNYGHPTFDTYAPSSFMYLKMSAYF